jgi:hypothetical protein
MSTGILKQRIPEFSRHCLGIYLVSAILYQRTQAGLFQAYTALESPNYLRRGEMNELTEIERLKGLRRELKKELENSYVKIQTKDKHKESNGPGTAYILGKKVGRTKVIL